MNTENLPRKPKLKYGVIHDPDYHRYAEWRYQRGFWEYQPEHIDTLFENWPHPEPEPDQDASAAALLSVIRGHASRPRLRPRGILRSLIQRTSRQPEKRDYTELLLPPALYYFLHDRKKLPDFDFREPRNPVGREYKYHNYWARHNGTDRGIWIEPDQDPISRFVNIPPADVLPYNLEEDLRVTWGNPDILDKDLWRAAVRVGKSEWWHLTHVSTPEESSLVENLPSWPISPEDACMVNSRVLFLRDQMSIIPIRFSNQEYKIYPDRPRDISWRELCSESPPILDWQELRKPVKKS